MKLTPWEPDLRSLIDRVELGDIDLQPDFQRQEVWSIAKKKKLIDTIIREWSIPPLHLITTRDGRLEVLDGQQRLAAIRDFLAGKFTIDGTIAPFDPIVSSLHGKTYRKLSDSVRRTIDQFTLRCFRISDFLPEEPSELFYRLNQPTILTAGEQRNALYGPAREQLKQVVEYFLSSGNSKDTIGFSNNRLSYDDIFARLLFFIEINNFAIKGTEARISDRFRTSEQFDHRVFSKTLRAIDNFNDARGVASKTKFNKASLLSWLLFYCRFDELTPDIEFMLEFYGSAAINMDVDTYIDVIGVFEDRASLRVTDVSSVVYRDVALWFLYCDKARGELPPTVSLPTINALRNRLAGKMPFEEALAIAVDVDLWGHGL